MCPIEETDDSRSGKRAKLHHPVAPLVPSHHHDTRHAHNMHNLANVATVIAAIVRLKRWMKCQHKASMARAADAAPAPKEPSLPPHHSDMAIDSAETIAPEEELISAAPSCDSHELRVSDAAL
jgi:hypothetical protein